MTDIFTKKKRSEIMSLISGKETQPEIKVRSQLFKKGFRFRKNLKTLPGKPDIVLSKYKTIIFVHGCFWHGHTCKWGKRPTSNTSFWQSKILGNIERDKRVKTELRNLGWKVLIVWDCQLRNKESSQRIIEKLVAKMTFLIPNLISINYISHFFR